MDTRQTVVVVTGAGSGMGRETALLFSQKDYTIVGVDINEATLKETIERTGQNKDKALAQLPM